MRQRRKEIFKPISGHPGYEASDRGNVRSSLGRKPRLLKSGTNSCGYPTVVLFNKGSRTTCQVHALVLLAFVRERPEGYVSRHLDGNPENNKLSNLVYGTHEENKEDSRRHGTLAKGDTHGTSTLSENEVREIRALCEEGAISQGMIAKQYGVSRGHINRINTGKRR